MILKINIAGWSSLEARRAHNRSVLGSSPRRSIFVFLAQWLSWLERRPVTAEVTGSSPVWVVHKWTTVERLLCILCINYGILAQLGEHLPYKQRVTGSSPVGPIFCFLNKITCRSGGTGRRPGLKIPWVVIPVPVRFRSAADYYMLQFLEKN